MKNVFILSLDLLSSPLQIKIIILENEEYSINIDKNTTAMLYATSVVENAKPISATAVSDIISNRIYVRKITNKVDLAAVIHEFLHANYPKVVEKKLDKATTVLKHAFRCYDKLYDYPELRNFFVELCKENNALSNLANLPDWI